MRQVARQYMQEAGLPYNPPQKYARVDPARAQRIADAYEQMPHDPDHPLVQAAYQQMAKEVMDQYAVAKRAGFKAEFWDPETEEDPYAASPRLAIEDIRKNHHMYVFPTFSGYGQAEITEEDLRQNPLLADSGERWNGKPVTINDIFRAIHDYYGHAKEGVGFRADGEENAWRAHASMFSPLARLAMTAETRGQNSWVNYGPKGEENRTASGADTVFADQKIGLVPLWVLHEGAEDFMDPQEIEHLKGLYERHGKANGGKIDRSSNLERYLQGNHPAVPERLLHVTTKDFSSFEPEFGIAAWAAGPEFADDFARSKFSYWKAKHLPWEDQPSPPNKGNEPWLNYMPVHLSAKNPFDSRKFISELSAPLRTIDQVIPLAKELKLDPQQIWDAIPKTKKAFDGQESPRSLLSADILRNQVVTDRLRELGHDSIIGHEFDQPVYAVFEPTQIKSATGNQGTFDPNDPDITKAEGGAVEHGGWHDYADGGAVKDYEPQRTVKAYKLFRVDKRKPGKLFPLFVNPHTEVPIGQWMEAEEGPQGSKKGKVKSRLGDLAYRPGWHAGDLPIATHIGGKSDNELDAPDYRPPNQVWAEIEMPDDVDWQSVANSRMEFNKKGEPKPATAHITDQIPFKGFYRYKTNPNMTGNWMIGGHMKVNRILSDDEVKSINDEAGTADLPRLEPSHAEAWGKFAQGGEVEDDEAGELSFSPVPSFVPYHEDPEYQNWFGKSKTHREGVPVTYYTGTSKDKDFDKFNVGRHGAWFSANPSEANDYAKRNDSQGYRYDYATGKMVETHTASRVIPVHLKIENPYRGPRPEKVLYATNYKKAQSDWFDTLRAAGYDGWIPDQFGGTLAVVLKEPQQVKSVNNRTWDPKNPRMDKAGGGEVEDDGITAYHGSPYDFDQFLMDRIGTGEGAQAYGHGLYFAENEDIAKNYRDSFSGMNREIVPIDDWKDMGKVREAAQKYYKDMPEEQNALVLLANWFHGGADPDRAIEKSLPHAASFGTTPEAITRVAREIYSPGRMYEVRINAHPDHFLDWDKPLGEQSEHVKTTLKDILGTDWIKAARVRMNGGELYSSLSAPKHRETLIAKLGSAEDVSKRLHEAGIKGIRYLDAQSRSAGEGTRNYVVFDDKLVDIKRKYADGGVVKESSDGKEAREDRTARGNAAGRPGRSASVNMPKSDPVVERALMIVSRKA